MPRPNQILERKRVAIIGDFDTAVVNGSRSIDSRDADDRNYTYSEMVLFFEEIGVVGKKDDK